jgi:predicted transposase YdaD
MLIKALERERETIRQEGFDSGKKEGFDSGKKEGFDSGKKEGIHEGIQERNRQIVQAMVAKGFPLPTIAALLNLALPEVELLLVETSPTAAESTP